MAYINKFGIAIDNQIDIIADIFDINLSLQKNSIPMSQDIGIFNKTSSEFNTISKDNLEIDLSNFINNNQYLSNNISLEPTINITDKLLYVVVKVNESNIDYQKKLIFDLVF